VVPGWVAHRSRKQRRDDKHASDRGGSMDMFDRRTLVQMADGTGADAGTDLGKLG
jgi:hypothetical protein